MGEEQNRMLPIKPGFFLPTFPEELPSSELTVQIDAERFASTMRGLNQSARKPFRFLIAAGILFPLFLAFILFPVFHVVLTDDRNLGLLILSLICVSVGLIMLQAAMACLLMFAGSLWRDLPMRWLDQENESYYHTIGLSLHFGPLYAKGKHIIRHEWISIYTFDSTEVRTFVPKDAPNSLLVKKLNHAQFMGIFPNQLPSVLANEIDADRYRETIDALNKQTRKESKAYPWLLCALALPGVLMFLGAQLWLIGKPIAQIFDLQGFAWAMVAFLVLGGFSFVVLIPASLIVMILMSNQELEKENRTYYKGIGFSLSNQGDWLIIERLDKEEKEEAEEGGPDIPLLNSIL